MLMKKNMKKIDKFLNLPGSSSTLDSLLLCFFNIHLGVQDGLLAGVRLYLIFDAVLTTFSKWSTQHNNMSIPDTKHNVILLNFKKREKIVNK